MEQVGLHPRVYYYHNFLTEDERAHMIRLAAPQVRLNCAVHLLGLLGPHTHATCRAMAHVHLGLPGMDQQHHISEHR